MFKNWMTRVATINKHRKSKVCDVEDVYDVNKIIKRKRKHYGDRKHTHKEPNEVVPEKD